ncbi:MAG TPA: glycosyltransferase family 4 protein [Gemmatimonadaceae bacterium]|nr:glycosyltransferase family 4 protein [Gemmatimonadaceae bacterium]
MKVLFVVTAYPRHDDDVITPWMGETIRRLRRAGVDVEVLAPAYKGGGATSLEGVRVHRFRYAPSMVETLTHDMPAVDRIRRNPLSALLLPSYVAAGSAAAARIARNGDFDIVHAFWPIPHGLFAIAAKRASRASLVSTFFSAELNWNGLLRRVFAPVIRAIVSNSDAVTVISTYTGERLAQYVPGVESVTIPFGAAAVRQSISATPVSREADDPFELLFIGRLVRRKGVDVLLRAVSILAADTRLQVRIVGRGPESENLIAEAARLRLRDRVIFEGLVAPERVHDLLQSCDALVLPAIITETGETEGLGVVLIEAMGYGKPVIATSAGGIVDIVRDGETGLLAPAGDAQALADTIVKAMDEPEELARIAMQGAAFAERAFGWDAIVRALLEVYESAAATRTGAKRGR